MQPRILVTSAGTGASNNVIRSLKDGAPSLFVVGVHEDRFVLQNSSADRRYLVSPSSGPDFPASLRRVVELERIDLVMPLTDVDVAVTSRLRRRLGCRVFLPRPATIERCRDKGKLTAFLRRRRVPAPLTYRVTNLRRIERLFHRLPRPHQVWCRIGTGSGSLGATLVTSPEQARLWIRCWEEFRGIPPTAFTLSEYLPGRDFGCQSLWRNGRLVLIKTCERLSYLGLGNQPGQVSSTAALMKTVNEPRIVAVCVKAVRTLDPRATGAFCIDLKQDSRGVAHVTEINAGRLSSATNAFDLAGKHNMAHTYVALGLGEPTGLRDVYDATEDWYMLRDLDSVPKVFHADACFDGIGEVPAPEGIGSATPRGGTRCTSL